MAHASDMTRPTKLSVPDVDIDCLEPQPASELRVADVVSPHVPPCDAAHDLDAPSGLALSLTLGDDAP